MKDSKLAPIVLFVYNRPSLTSKVLEALMANKLADLSQLFIFSDGPKDETIEEDRKMVLEVRKLIHQIDWCKQVKIFESEINKGPDSSIIEGVSKILEEYDKIIVLEDDLIVSKGFLEFMNNALELYRNEKRVMHISGHSFPLFKRNNCIYFLKYVSPWGWATWSDRWKYFEHDAALIYYKLEQNQVDWKDFNSGYGNEFKDQLLANVNNRWNTWDIKWHSSVYFNEGLTLFPKISLVRNIGFYEGGSHTNILRKILSNQKIALRNEFKFCTPVFDKRAFRKLHFFYLCNVLFKKKNKKIMNIAHKTFRLVISKIESWVS